MSGTVLKFSWTQEMMPSKSVVVNSARPGFKTTYQYPQRLARLTTIFCVDISTITTFSVCMDEEIFSPPPLLANGVDWV